MSLPDGVITMCRNLTMVEALKVKLDSPSMLCFLTTLSKGVSSEDELKQPRNYTKSGKFKRSLSKRSTLAREAPHPMKVNPKKPK